MTLQKYQIIKLLYSGIVSVEFEGDTNFRVGDIYHHSPTIKSIIKRVSFYKNYEGKKTNIITELI